MAKFEYLLTLPILMGETIRLHQPCHIGHEADGRPIAYDALDPRSFDRSFLDEPGFAPVWHAGTEVESLDELNELYGFHSGAIVSPRVRRIIEEEKVPNVEFIPLEIRTWEAKRLLGEWWFVNVFNWRKVFDFDRSKVSYTDFFQPITGLRTISRRFGELVVRGWQVLEVHQEAITDGLFLAEAPSEALWGNVFISEHLAHQINDGLPKERQIYFTPFWLDKGPGPKFDRRPYRYAGGKKRFWWRKRRSRGAPWAQLK